MTTNEKTYDGLARAYSLQNSGTLRGNMDVRELREAIEGLAAIVFVLTQHINDNDSVKTDAMAEAAETAEGILDDLMVDPDAPRPPSSLEV